MSRIFKDDGNHASGTTAPSSRASVGCALSCSAEQKTKPKSRIMAKSQSRIRQSSATPLHGTVTTKTKEKKPEENDPIVVFDGHEDSGHSDEQIELGVRQPSFVSLHGQIIPKGGDSLADLHTVIEENIATNGDSNQSKNKTLKHDDGDNDDDDPQVKIVKILEAKNAGRWAEIGYKPPQDFVHLARVRSQVRMHDAKDLTRNGYFSTSLTKFYMNPETEVEMMQQISEMNEETNHVVQKPNKRKRSGSFGMKIGEASASIERMQEIIPDETETGKNYCSERLVIMNNERIAIDDDLEETKESVELFGHLKEIVKENSGSPVLQTILTGENPPASDIPIVKKALRKYLKISSMNGWNEEASFLNNLIEELPASHSYSSTKFNIKKTKNEHTAQQTEIINLKKKFVFYIQSKKFKKAKRLENKIIELEGKRKKHMASIPNPRFSFKEIQENSNEVPYKWSRVLTHTLDDIKVPVSLIVNAPKRINRDNDLSIIKKLTNEALKGRKIPEIPIERTYHQTYKRNG